MRSTGRTAVAVVIMVIAAACSSAGEPSGDTAPSSVPVTVPAGTSGASGSASSGTAVVVVDPCSAPIPDDLFALDEVADLPSVEDDAAATLGRDGAEALLEDLLDVDGGLCALEVSPSVQAALEEADRAAGSGDPGEARRILETILDAVIAEGLSSWMPMMPGVYAAGADSGAPSLQTVRDLLAVAGKAEYLGEEDIARDAWDAALDAFTDYAMGTEDHPGEIETLDDPRKLLTLAAQAAILGLEDISDEAIAKALEIYEKKLDKITDEYEPCTATREDLTELLRAAAPVELLGGDTSYARSLVVDTLDIAERRALGEPVPECDAAGFTDTVPIGGPWAGDMDVSMSTCDGIVWEGTFAMEGTYTGTDGSASIVGTGEFTVEIDPATGRGEAPFTYSQFTSFSAEGGSGTHDAEGTGTVKLAVDRHAGTADVTIEIDSWIATITATVDGRTYSITLPQEGFSTALLGAKLVHEAPCDDE